MKNLKNIIKILTIFLLAIFVSNANAEGFQEYNNQKVSVSLHPVSYFLSPLSKDIETPFNIYLTTEIPLNLSYSLIIQPSLLIGKYDNFRFGSGVGVRHFINRKGEGIYLQAMIDFYRYSIKFDDYDYDNTKYKKGFYGDLLGYFGYSYKNSGTVISFDIGIGTLYPNPNIIENYRNLVPTLEKYFLLDANLSIDFLTFSELL